jgi:peptidoglycan L-alanyl-D-glutamate endopeptidase CwlK
LCSSPVFKIISMKDKISIERLAQLHPKVRDVFRAFIEEIETAFNTTYRITQGLRTFAEQQALYEQSRNGSGKPWATNAKAGQSYHNYGLAIDIVELVNSKPNWQMNTTRLQPYATKHGLTWGGTFTHIDPDHFEYSFGHGPSGFSFFLQLHNEGKVDDGGYVVV